MSEAAANRVSEDWLERLAAGDRRTLARAITAVENEKGDASGILGAIYPRLGRALVLGVTGPPGAGKSTLVNAMVGELRGRGRSVGVVAVDPSSPKSGGAILGDRIRMHQHDSDGDVFVRSLAARGHLGGLSRATARVVDVMDASGKEIIIVETVGAGQADVEIAELADIKVVVCAPGLGDDIQAIKAGILEIADILVVNKNDSPLADRAVAELEGAVGLTANEADRPPVLRTTATEGAGVDVLTDTVFALWEARDAQARRAGPKQRVRRLIAQIASEQVKARLMNGEKSDLDGLCEAVLKGELDFDAAARRALEFLKEYGGT